MDRFSEKSLLSLGIHSAIKVTPHKDRLRALHGVALRKLAEEGFVGFTYTKMKGESTVYRILIVEDESGIASAIAEQTMI